MKDNGTGIGEPRFTQAEMGQSICDAVGEMRDLLVRGFVRDDAGINADRGGTSIPYRYACSDGNADAIFKNTCVHPYVNIWSRAPFAVQIREIEDETASRIEPQWLPFADGFASLKLVPGQPYAVLTYGGGGNVNSNNVSGLICVLETLSPVLLKNPAYGPFPFSAVLSPASISTTPTTIITALAGYDTVISHLHIRRIGTGTRIYTLRNADSTVLYQVQLNQDEPHTVTLPRGSELIAEGTSGLVDLVDNNAVGSAANICLLAKRVPTLG